MIGTHAFSSLKHRDFRLFWLGSFWSEVASQMQVVAINWQIYELTRSPLALGLIGLASFLPIPLTALLGGLAADKVDRKRLLIYCTIAQAALSTALAVTTGAGLASPPIIYGAIALSFVVRTFQAPARQAIIPHLVPASEFMNAVSLSTMVRQASIVVGPAIAGFVIEFQGVGGVYVLNVVSYVALIAVLLPIAIAHIKPAKPVTFSIASVMEGIHFVRRTPILLSTMILDFFANFFASATTMLPVFAQEVLGQGASGLGIMYSAPSIGAITAGLLVASIRDLRHPGRAIVIGVVLYGLATIGFGLSRTYWISLVCLALVGAGDMISTVLRNTIRQWVTPDEIRGRMVSVNMIFIQGGPQLGELEAGLLAASLGAPASVVIGGVGAVVSALIVYVRAPKLRDYQTGPDPAVEGPRK